VAYVPARLSDAAMVNAVATVAEAKAQALRELGFEATGTSTDAVCLLTADGPGGPDERYGGPRSRWGRPLAWAAYQAIVIGGRRCLAESAR
jgi:adenosylcobinamide amidohydrolase